MNQTQKEMDIMESLHQQSVDTQEQRHFVSQQLLTEGREQLLWLRRLTDETDMPLVTSKSGSADLDELSSHRLSPSESLMEVKQQMLHRIDELENHLIQLERLHQDEQINSIEPKASVNYYRQLDHSDTCAPLELLLDCLHHEAA